MARSGEFGSEQAIAEDSKLLLTQGSSCTRQQQQLSRVCTKAALALISVMLGALLLLGSGRFDLVANLAEGHGIVAVHGIAAVPKWPRSSSRVAEHVLGLHAPSGISAGLDHAESMKLRYVSCAIDANNGVFWLMQGANAIRRAIDDCKGKVTTDGAGRRTCATDVSVIIAGVANTVAYLTFAATTCSGSDSIPTICAGSLAGLVAVMGEFSESASALRDSCTNPRRLHDLPKFSLNATSLPKLPTSVAPHRGLTRAKSFFGKYSAKLRKQAAKIGAGQADPGRAIEISQCVVDVDLGLSYATRSALQARALAAECPSGNKKLCIIDIFNILGAINHAIPFLAQISTDCPGVDNWKVACTASVTDFIEDVAGAGPVFNGIADDCSQINIPPGSPLPVGPGNFA